MYMDVLMTPSDPSVAGVKKHSGHFYLKRTAHYICLDMPPWCSVKCASYCAGP